MGVVSLSNTRTGVDTGYVRLEVRSEVHGCINKSFQGETSLERCMVSLVNRAPSLPTSMRCRKEDYCLRVGGRMVGGREGRDAT